MKTSQVFKTCEVLQGNLISDVEQGITNVENEEKLLFREELTVDILKQVAELKEFLGKVYCFIEDNEDSFKDGVEAEEVKNEIWKWMQELAKFLPEV